MLGVEAKPSDGADHFKSDATDQGMDDRRLASDHHVAIACLLTLIQRQMLSGSTLLRFSHSLSEADSFVFRIFGAISHTSPFYSIEILQSSTVTFRFSFYTNN